MTTCYDERAAILQFDQGMSRDDAERQAFREVYAERLALKPDGILGELITASHVRLAPSLADETGRQGFDHGRVVWGFGWIVPGDRGTYRPADHVEPAHSALICPAIQSGQLNDLVAFALASRRVLTRRDVAAIIGADEVERARATKSPVYIFPDPLAWLRGGGLGAVVVDWPRVGRELDGVRSIICGNQALAARLHAGTSRCFPVPTIATVAPKDRHAA